MNKGNAVISAGLIIFGSGALLAAVNYPRGSAIMPVFYAVSLIVLSSLLLIRSVKASKKVSAEEKNAEPYKKIVMIIVFIAVYMLMVPILGFYSSTALFLFAFITLTRASRALTALIIALTTTITVYSFFELLLHVPAPQGLFI